MSPTSQRKEAQARREARRKRRATMLELVAYGFSYEKLAARYKVSLATVRREVDRALAARRTEPHETYVKMQLTRLDKALQIVNLKLEEGDMRALPALVALLQAYDRYHGAAAMIEAGARAARPLQNLAPKALESLQPATLLSPDAQPVAP